MLCMWEHIHRRYLNCAIATILQHKKITCQRTRITTHIHHSLRLHLQDRFQQTWITALARWINYDHISFNTLFFLAWNTVLGSTNFELHVTHLVQERIAASIFNRFGHDLHPVYLIRMLRQEKRVRSTL